MSYCKQNVIDIMTEEQLTKGLQAGDNLARKELYERLAGQMLSLCRRYVGQSDEAEDLLHDGFLQIFSQIGKFTWRGEGTLAAWVRRVMTNHVLSALEKEKRLATDDIDEVPDMGADDNDAPPDISTDVIMQLIAELPTGYRTVLNLFLVEGWSHAEIAEKLNIKESTSASQYLRAKKLLKDKILNYINLNDL